MHVGASWNRDLTYQRAFRMGGEFKTKGVNVALGPVSEVFLLDILTFPIPEPQPMRLYEIDLACI